MLNNHIYLFSGLGADKRVFRNLEFSGFEVTHIHWISPINKEPIEQYAKRISEQIKHKEPILIGLSFGGIMAIEVAKLLKVKKVILIASAKTYHEIPFYYRLPAKLNLHQLIPSALLKHNNIFTRWFFGANSNAEKRLLKSILNDTDPHFLNWALNASVKWKNKIAPSQLVHIHGTADRILPIRFVKCDFEIENGGHFMTLNKANEIEEVLCHLLKQ